MAGQETLNGSEVTEVTREQIATWDAEGGAEPEPEHHVAGRHLGDEAEHWHSVAVWLTPQETLILDERARREGKCRSDVIRSALNF